MARFPFNVLDTDVRMRLSFGDSEGFVREIADGDDTGTAGMTGGGDQFEQVKIKGFIALLAGHVGDYEPIWSWMAGVSSKLSPA